MFDFLELFGARLKGAAAEAGLTTYRAREYLMKPHVLRFLRDQKQALLEEIKETGGGVTRHAPGMVVVIQYNDGRSETIGAPLAPMVDVTPEREALEPPAR